MCNNTIKIQGHKIQFNIQGQIGCYRDFSNEEQLKTHLLQCVKEMTQFTCEVCSQVFKKKEYTKRHMTNIHGQVPNIGPKVVEVNKKDEGSDKESSDEDSQEDDDIEKYNPGELIGDISDDGDNHHDDKHEKPNSSNKTDMKGTSDLELGRTQRKSCSPRPVAASVKRKLDVSANTRISEELVEADRSQKVDVVSNDTQIVNVEPSKRLKMDELHQDKVTQTNVAKERKMVKIVTKYVEEGRQVEKIEEHETIWIV